MSVLIAVLWSQALQMTVNMTSFVISNIFAGILLLIILWLDCITKDNPWWNESSCIIGHKMIFKPQKRLFVFQGFVFFFPPSGKQLTKLVQSNWEGEEGKSDYWSSLLNSWLKDYIYQFLRNTVHTEGY